VTNTLAYFAWLLNTVYEINDNCGGFFYDSKLQSLCVYEFDPWGKSYKTFPLIIYEFS
jgi:hypothetical protein